MVALLIPDPHPLSSHELYTLLYSFLFWPPTPFMLEYNCLDKYVCTCYCYTVNVCNISHCALLRGQQQSPDILWEKPKEQLRRSHPIENSIHSFVDIIFLSLALFWRAAVGALTQISICECLSVSVCGRNTGLYTLNCKCVCVCVGSGSLGRCWVGHKLDVNSYISHRLNRD